MMNSGSPADIENTDKASSYCLMSKSELEVVAVVAIREHRRLLAADQEVYDEWVRASEDATTSADVLRALQDEHLTRQGKSEAQQFELARIIDALGFIPSLPEDAGGSN